MRKDQTSINTPHFSIQLVPTSGLNSLNYSNLSEFQSDVMLFIKTVLYSSNFITIIEFLESKINNFFTQNEDLKLFLFKIQYFHYILIKISQDHLNQFYINNIQPIIAKKSNYEKIKRCLVCIRDNPSVVDSRYYPQMREECFRLFELSVHVAIEEIFSPKKKTEMNEKDYEYYLHNKGRLETIEFDLIKQSSIPLTEPTSEKPLANQFTLFSTGNVDFISFSNEVISNNDMNNDYNDKRNDDTKQKGHIEQKQQQSLNSKLLNNDILPFESFDFQQEGGNDMNIDEDTLFNNSSSAQTSINHLNSNCFSLNALNDNFYSTQGLLFEQNRNTGPQINHNSKQKNKTITRLTQPSIQKEKKNKLKKFQFKFTKRENIDKKILRKFRKFLSQRIKKNDDFITKIVLNSDFWVSFINKNLLPPFIYIPENKTFKSFNTRFMLWIFEHDNSAELYSYYIKSNYQQLVDSFAAKFNLKEGNEEFASLKNYINCFAQVFGNSSQNSSSTTEATKVTYDYVFEGEPNNKQREMISSDTNEDMFYKDNGINSIQQKTNDIFEEIITNDYLHGSKSMGYFSYENEDIMMNYYDDGLNSNQYGKNDGEFM